MAKSRENCGGVARGFLTELPANSIFSGSSAAEEYEQMAPKVRNQTFPRYEDLFEKWVGMNDIGYKCIFDTCLEYSEPDSSPIFPKKLEERW